MSMLNEWMNQSKSRSAKGLWLPLSLKVVNSRPRWIKYATLNNSHTKCLMTSILGTTGKCGRWPSWPLWLCTDMTLAEHNCKSAGNITPCSRENKNVWVKQWRIPPIYQRHSILWREVCVARNSVYLTVSVLLDSSAFVSPILLSLGNFSRT